MIISVDAEKAFDKIQYPIMIKSSEETRTRRNVPHNKKTIYGKPIANTLNGKTETISSKVRNETRVPTLSTLFQYTLVLNHSDEVRERNKRDSNRKRKDKLFLFADDMILSLKDPKKSIKKHLDLINIFGKVTRFKISLQNQ
jgi:hypothetical protein